MVATVEVNLSVHGLKAPAIDNCLYPNVTIICVVQVMLLVYPQANLISAVVTLNIQEETLIIRT